MHCAMLVGVSSSATSGSMNEPSSERRGLEGETEASEAEMEEEEEVLRRRNGGSDFRLLIPTFFQAAVCDDRLASSRSFVESSRSACVQHSGDACERRYRKASLDADTKAQAKTDDDDCARYYCDMGR